MSEELIQTAVQAEIGSQPTATVAFTGAVPTIPEGMVDITPEKTQEVEGEIKRLEEVRNKAKADARYWRQQKAEARADYFKSRKEPEKSPEPTPDLGIGAPPRSEDFEDYNKYVDAKVSYEVNKAKTTWDRDQARKNVEAAQQDKMAKLHEKISLGFEKYSDFGEVVIEDATAPITAAVGEALAELENPADVAYYLAKNRAEGIKISRMTPIQIAVALAKIDKEVALKAVESPTKPKTISNAPPPIKPVGASHTVEKDPEKMSQREYEEWALKRGMRRF